MPIAISHIDRKGLITFVNRETENRHKKTHKDLVGTPWQHHKPSDYQDLNEGLIAQTLAGIETSFETTTLFPDGITRDVQVSLLPDSSDKETQAMGFFMLSLDITNRKVQEQASRQLSERFKALFDKGSMAILFFDMAGHIIAANPAFLSLIGREEQDLIGESYHSFTHKEDQAKERALMEALRLKKQENYQIEKRVLRKDGQIRWIAYSCGMIFDDGGNPWFGLGIAQDIHERHAVTETLKRRDAILKAIAFAAETLLLPGDPVSALQSVLEKLGNSTQVQRIAVYEHMPLAAASSPPSLKLIAEWAEWAEWTNSSSRKTLHDDCWPPLLQNEKQSLEAGQALFGQSALLPPALASLLTASGIQSYAILPILSDGHLQGVMTIEDWRQDRLWQDPELDALAVAAKLIGAARQRVALETALRTAHHEAEKASEAKTRFLASASHDLRQPLQSMTLLISVLSNRLQDPETQDLAHMIEHAVTGLNDLLSGMLDISKLEAGLVTAHYEHFDLGALVGRVKADFMVEAEVKGLPLLARRRPVHVYSDPTLLGRILRNLVANAVRYTEHGPGILIAMRQRGSKARIEVWDSGPGIPEEKQDDIFEDFQQLNNAHRARSQGVGLGLAIVKRLSHLLNISIEVRSKLGHGSRFALEIPLSTEPQDTLPPAPIKKMVDLHGKTIFIIDDDQDVLQSLSLLLSSWGCRTFLYDTAETALAGSLSLTTTPDLVMADFRLPEGWNGVQLIKALAQQRDWHFPSLILTGDTAPEQLLMVQNSDCKLLHKPISPLALKQAIMEVL